MTPAELESLASRTLPGLPGPKAPTTLLPSVLAQLERARRRPWYRRAWRYWPPACQAVGAVAIVAMVWFAGAGLERVESELAQVLGLAGVLWRLVVEPNAVYLATLACVMAMAGAAYCVALSWLLWEGMSKR